MGSCRMQNLNGNISLSFLHMGRAPSLKKREPRWGRGVWRLEPNPPPLPPPSQIGQSAVLLTCFFFFKHSKELSKRSRHPSLFANLGSQFSPKKPPFEKSAFLTFNQKQSWALDIFNSPLSTRVLAIPLWFRVT